MIKREEIKAAINAITSVLYIQIYSIAGDNEPPSHQKENTWKGFLKLAMEYFDFRETKKIAKNLKIYWSGLTMTLASVFR